MAENKKKNVLAVVFDAMLVMDFNGPHTVMNDFYNVITVAIKGNKTSIVSSEGLHIIADYHFDNLPETKFDILLIPGGRGTRKFAQDEEFISQIKQLCQRCDNIFTVCTGAALLAKTGLLDGKQATSNKMAWEWVISQGPNVKWIKEKRWVDDGIFLTSAGVSAGIDAALYLIGKEFGKDNAILAATRIEYAWNDDPDDWQKNKDKK